MKDALVVEGPSVIVTETHLAYCPHYISYTFSSMQVKTNEKNIHAC